MQDLLATVRRMHEKRTGHNNLLTKETWLKGR